MERETMKKMRINWELASRQFKRRVSRDSKYKSSRIEVTNDSMIIQCSKCDQIFTIQQPTKPPFEIYCPHCEHIIKIKKQSTKEQTTARSKLRFKHVNIIPREGVKKKINDNIIELVLIVIGILFLLQPTMDNIKISFTLILIASFLLLLITGEEKPEKLNTKSNDIPPHKRQLHTSKHLKKLHDVKERLHDIPFSNRIGIVLILWTLLLYVITADIEIYFILIFIGILITRELTNLYTSDLYKKRLNGYIVLFLFTYIVLISQKIIEILSA